MRGGGDPGCRDPRDRREARLQGGKRGRQARREPDEGGCRRGRLREQVGQHAVYRNDGSDEHQERAAGELSREGHREGQGERSRQDARHPAGERTSEQQQRCRRGDRQRESQRSRQPRVGHDDHCDAEREDRHARCGASEKDAEHGDRGHRGGAKHTGLGRDENDEPREGDHAGHHPDPPACADCGRSDKGDADDQGAVRARDCREVRQRRFLHVGIELRVHSGCVAHSKAGLEARARVREPADSGDEPLPKVGGDRENAGRLLPHSDATGCRHIQHGSITWPRGPGGAAHLDLGADVEAVAIMDIGGVGPDGDLGRDLVDRGADRDAMRHRVESEAAVGPPLDLARDGGLDGDGASSSDRQVRRRVSRRLGDGDMGCRSRGRREAEHRDDDEPAVDRDATPTRRQAGSDHGDDRGGPEREGDRGRGIRIHHRRVRSRPRQCGDRHQPQRRAARHGVTPSRGRAAIPAACRRCLARRADPRRS